MFTGIITHIAKMDFCAPDTLLIPPVFSDAQVGESIALNGVCLTVEKILSHKLQFHCGSITKKLTNLGFSQIVNVERALRVGDSIGGHFVTGHIDTTLRFLQKRRIEQSIIATFTLPKDRTSIIPKGSISINGVSLTIATISLDTFSVQIIPHTMQNTNLHSLQSGDLVNVEFDIFAKYAKEHYEYSRN
ncbi:MAG: riboflavin synthase [Caldisericia bacterium]|nr:riboflavin synthase [Caldisericia bacterium]MDD4615098.1 riboflavin synthase [Caldisericia bacterium]